jgi:hypothetical protein
MASNFLFLVWLLIWLIRHPVRAMTASMERLAMTFSMVREEMIVSFMCGVIVDLQTSNLTCTLVSDISGGSGEDGK